MTSTAHSIDAKTDRFTQYLDKSEAVDKISKALVALYEEPEKPENPIDFIKTFLGVPTIKNIQEVQREVETLRDRNETLERMSRTLRQDVEVSRKKQGQKSIKKVGEARRKGKK
jgi:hypothetical protein